MPGSARGTVWQMWLLLPPSREPGQQKHRSCSAFTLQRIPAPLAQGWEQAPSLPQETPGIARSHIQEMPARVWPDPALLVAPSASRQEERSVPQPRGVAGCFLSSTPEVLLWFKILGLDSSGSAFSLPLQHDGEQSA